MLPHIARQKRLPLGHDQRFLEIHLPSKCGLEICGNLSLVEIQSSITKNSERDAQEQICEEISKRFHAP